MPAWSIAEWRARIGSSWCALGRPFKTRSPFRNGSRRQRVFTLNQMVTFIFLLMMLIVLNVGLRSLVRGGHHLYFLSEYIIATRIWNNKLQLQYHAWSSANSIVWHCLYMYRYFQRWQNPSKKIFDQFWPPPHLDLPNHSCSCLPVSIYHDWQLSEFQY